MIFWFFWQSLLLFLPMALYVSSIWYGAHLLMWAFNRLSWHMGWHTDYDPATGKIRGSKRFWRWAIKHLKPQLDEIFKAENKPPATT